ncbi:MAG TPA: hypothetical protein PLP14_06765, partial [Chitinophagaceae bacterium]|nr:hypothetical protein [Chitinophagaceae bacterium]
GAEARLGKISLRGGFQANGNPYTNTASGSSKTWSGGLGFRERFWYTDVAVSYGKRTSGEWPYILMHHQDEVSLATINTTLTRFVMTLGVRF